MKTGRYQFWARVLATVTLAIQLVAPGALAAAHSAGFDVGTLICAPSGEVSPELAAAMAELSDALSQSNAEDAAPQNTDIPGKTGQTCLLCVASFAVVQPVPAITATRHHCATPAHAFQPERNAAQAASGPPLGMRAPPHITSL